MPEELTTYGDQNYALRVAVEDAARRIRDEIYNWPKEKTARYYSNLFEGKLKINWELEHPEGIDPR